MTVKIIDPGPMKFWNQCLRCNAKFTYELSDLKMNYIKGKECIHCPTCGESVTHRALESK